MIGGPAEHGTVDLVEMADGIRHRRNAAIDADETFRKPGLQPVDPLIVERRDVAVLLRAQALQPGLAGMHPQGVGTSGKDTIGQDVEGWLRVLIVDADAAFDGDRYPYRCLHRRDTVGNECWGFHKAGAERTGLNTVRGAADIEVDLVIAETFADARCLGELLRVRSAKLQRDRVFGSVKTQ